MRPKRIVLRKLARADAEDAVDYYAQEAGRALADRFLTSLERAFRHIARNPATGSPRYGFELDLPGLRSMPLSRFPYLVFFVEQADRIDVWRILHTSRDIPKWVRDRGAS